MTLSLIFTSHIKKDVGKIILYHICIKKCYSYIVIAVK